MNQAWARQRRALGDWLRWLGAASDGARALELPGATAAVVPATPQRSLINSAVCDSTDALERSYEELAATYEAAGIRAWTVWVPEHEREAMELLTSRGHVFDGEPMAMSLALGDHEPREAGELHWDADGTAAELGRLNDAAYGLDERSGMGAAIGPAPAAMRARIYRARLGGELGCVLMTMEHGRDLGIYFVATAERLRGRGLASRLLSVALVEARRSGRLDTSSLQSSAMGEPVYAALGYRRQFRLHLYERRLG